MERLILVLLSNSCTRVSATLRTIITTLALSYCLPPKTNLCKSNFFTDSSKDDLQSPATKLSKMPVSLLYGSGPRAPLARISRTCDKFNAGGRQQRQRRRKMSCLWPGKSKIFSAYFPQLFSFTLISSLPVSCSLSSSPLRSSSLPLYTLYAASHHYHHHDCDDTGGTRRRRLPLTTPRCCRT